MAKKLWTVEEDLIVERGVKAGKNFRAIIPDLDGRTRSAIMQRSHILGLEPRKGNRKYTYNPTFFDVPNKINAYVAGFLAADGSVITSKSGKSFVLSVGLQRGDAGFLLTLIDLMGANCPLCYYESNGRKYAKFAICATEWQEPLERIWGIIQSKTWKLKEPKIPKDLMRDYWKGYTDGDGTIYTGHPFEIKLCAAIPDILIGFKDYANTFPSFEMFNRIPKLRQCNDLWVFSRGGHGGILLAHDIYSSNSPVLPRKYNALRNYLMKNPEKGLSLPPIKEAYKRCGLDWGKYKDV
jgi:hypothetical protein